MKSYIQIKNGNPTEEEQIAILSAVLETIPSRLEPVKPVSYWQMAGRIEQTTSSPRQVPQPAWRCSIKQTGSWPN